MKLKKNIDYLSISIIFCLLFNVTYIFTNPKSKQNYNKLGFSLEFKQSYMYFLVNLLVILFVLFLNYLFLKLGSINSEFEKKENVFRLMFILIGSFPILVSSLPIKNTQMLQKIYSFYRISHDELNRLNDLRFFIDSMNRFYIDDNKIIDNFTKLPSNIYNYPTSLLRLKFLGQLNDYKFVVYYILSFMFLFIIALMVKNRISFLVQVGMILSASGFLIFERGNLELLIVPLCYFSVLFAKKGGFGIIVGAIFILLAAQVKIHPIILLFYFFILSKKNKLIMFGVSLIALLGLVQLVQDYRIIGISKLSFGYGGTFGLSTAIGILEGFSSPLSSFSKFSLGMLIVVTQFVFVATLAIKSINIHRIESFDFKEVYLFIFGSTMILVSFLFTSSYGYRLLMFTLCVPFLIRVQEKNLKLASFIFVLFLVGSSTFPLTLTPIRTSTITVAVALLSGILYSVLIQFKKGYKVKASLSVK